jgi:hypothetical protein
VISSFTLWAFGFPVSKGAEQFWRCRKELGFKFGRDHLNNG